MEENRERAKLIKIYCARAEILQKILFAFWAMEFQEKLLLRFLTFLCPLHNGVIFFADTYSWMSDEGLKKHRYVWCMTSSYLTYMTLTNSWTLSNRLEKHLYPSNSLLDWYRNKTKPILPTLFGCAPKHSNYWPLSWRTRFMRCLPTTLEEFS